MREWIKSGAPWVWLNAGAVSVSIVMTLGLIAWIAIKGLGHFWPNQVLEASYNNPRTNQVINLVGERIESEEIPAQQLREAGVNLPAELVNIERMLLKTGNRDVYGSDFRPILPRYLGEIRYPREIVAIERREWGNFYGRLISVRENGQEVARGEDAWDKLLERIDYANELHAQAKDIEKGGIGSINYDIERLRLKQRGYELDGELTEQVQAELDGERKVLQTRYEVLRDELLHIYEVLEQDSITASAMNGEVVTIPLSEIVRAYQPNAMSTLDKIGFYFIKVWEFVSAEPREANTEGGVFPAIFGTVMMVLVMSVLVTPFGVIAAVYLKEYAKQGVVTRTIRIAVNNLAGVPSIVYGVFGLGFFVYFLGGSLDQLFYPEALPAPTFGTPGLLWASLTLALLTLPVVIVATEEGLSRVPRAIREGSLALGATKAETLWRTVLPMTSPAMMTGLILAVARAAGEVAPLMLVGVVKLAPSLPLDGNYPFLHLDQKFMHLGFHIYDVGFQSPNVEAARPLVYATAFLLVLVIALLNLSAIGIRNRLREKFKALEH